MISDLREPLRLKGSDPSRDLTLPEGMAARLGEEEMAAPVVALTPRENIRESSMVGMKSPKKKVIRAIVGCQNQQNLYLIPPTGVVKLLQYSGSRVELRDGFSS